MAKRVLEKPTKKQEDFSLFQGLTEEQIRWLVEADVIALAPHGWSDCLNAMKELYRRAGILFTTATARHYAERATLQKKSNLALFWWKIVYDAGEESPYRQLVVARYGVEAAEKACGKLMHEEYMAIGQRYERIKNLDEALTAFTKAKEQSAITRIFVRAVALGDIKTAERAVDTLQRHFTDRELKTLLEKAIERMVDEDITLHALLKHKAGKRLVSLFLWQYIRRMTNFRFANQYARKLGVRLSNAQLYHLYRTNRKEDYKITYAIEIAKVLVRRGVRGWRQRLRYLYAQAREHSLGNRMPSVADRYGRKCGKPLTISEIQCVAAGFDSYTAAEWERREWRWCMDRMTHLIARAVGATKALASGKAG